MWQFRKQTGLILTGGVLLILMCQIGKDSFMGRGWRQEEKECQRMRWLVASPTQWREFEPAPGDSEDRKPAVLQSVGLQRVGRDLVSEQQIYYKETFPFLNVGQCLHIRFSIQGSISWHFPWIPFKLMFSTSPNIQL